MINRVELIGNLGAAPEIRSVGDSDRVANLRIATKETWRDRESGERREKTEWHRVSVWGEQSVRYLETYADTGSLVRLEGELRTRKWNDDGQDRYTTEVVVQGRKGEVKILAGFAGRKADPGQAPASEPIADDVPF